MATMVKSAKTKEAKTKLMIMGTHLFENISTSFLIAIFVKSQNFSKKRKLSRALAPSAVSRLRNWKTEIQYTLSFLECSKFISVDPPQQNWSGNFSIKLVFMHVLYNKSCLIFMNSKGIGHVWEIFGYIKILLITSSYDKIKHYSISGYFPGYP